MADAAKMAALTEYERVREQGKNLDGSRTQVSHEETMAFLCGWDALLAHIKSRAERDSDEHPAGENAKRLSGEAMPARASEGGIAQHD